jgi:hypothetical protein
MNRAASGVTEGSPSLFPACRAHLEFGIALHEPAWIRLRYLDGWGAVQSIFGFAPR